MFSSLQHKQLVKSQSDMALSFRTFFSSSLQLSYSLSLSVLQTDLRTRRKRKLRQKLKLKQKQRLKKRLKSRFQFQKISHFSEKSEMHSRRTKENSVGDRQMLIPFFF